MSVEAIKFGFVGAIVVAVVIFFLIWIDGFAREMDRLLEDTLGEDGAERVRDVLRYIFVFLFLVFLFSGFYDLVTNGIPMTRDLFLEAIK